MAEMWEAWLCADFLLDILSHAQVVQVNFVGDRDSFVWKGHDPLQVKGTPIRCEGGFRPDMVVQLSPPAGVTALALQSKWGL